MKKRPLVRTNRREAKEEGTKDEESKAKPQNFFRDFYFTMDVIVCECACVE